MTALVLEGMDGPSIVVMQTWLDRRIQTFCFYLVSCFVMAVSINATALPEPRQRITSIYIEIDRDIQN